jgi:hypothetical protein
MQAVLHLRVTSAFVAFRDSSDKPAFCIVPKGAVVERFNDSTQRGLVPIKLDDQSLLAFPRDLQDRAEPLDGSFPRKV